MMSRMRNRKGGRLKMGVAKGIRMYSGGGDGRIRNSGRPRPSNPGWIILFVDF